MSNIIQLEDWTRGDPLEAERLQADTQQRMLQDMRKMAREIVRLRKIERAAEQIILHHANGDVHPTSPLACHAVVELGRALVSMPQWRRT